MPPLLRNTFAASYSARQRNASGFALIIAMVLMGFILLLLISLSVLINVETQNTTHQKSISEAKQNALLGLGVALGRLQAYAGPDQRITAQADILGNNVANPYWTGVWKAQNEFDPDDPATFNSNAQFMGWLVSGFEDQPIEPNAAAADSLSNEALVNMDRNNMDRNANRHFMDNRRTRVVWTGSATEQHGVVVPLREVGDMNQPDGYYGYWIGDEGVKAKYNVHDPLADDISSDEKRIQRFRSAQGVGMHSLEYDVFKGFSAYEPGNVDLRNITQFDDIALSLNDNSMPNEAFFDLTVHSQGVLSDVKQGGLKQDLTMAFENDDAFDDFFTESGWGRPFEPLGSSAPLRSQGLPNWNILRDYYLLYDEGRGALSDSTGVNKGALSVSTLKLPSGVSDFTNNKYHVPYVHEKHLYHQNNPIFPIMSSVQLGFGFEYEYDTTTLEYYPLLHIKPIFGLYNPHNVALNATSFHGEWSVIPRITVQKRRGTTLIDEVSFYLHEVLNSVLNDTSSSGVRFRWITKENAGFRPGETRLFSLVETVSDSDALTKGKGGGTRIEMGTEWDSDATLFIDLTNSPFVRTATKEDTVSDGVFQKTKEPESFGLTDDERTRLRIPQAEAEPDIDGKELEITLKIELGPGSPGTLWNKAHNGGRAGTVQQWGEIFQDESDRAPGESVDSYALDALDSKETLCTFRFGLRTAKNGGSDGTPPARFLIDSNLRSIITHTAYDGFNNDQGFDVMSIFQGDGTKGLLDGPDDPQVDTDARGDSYYGPSRHEGDNLYTVLFDVPREPLVSLGSLQHAAIGRYNFDPTYIIGNSYANPRIRLSDVKKEGFAGRYNLYDWSYSLNHYLWDSYFFSTATSVDKAELEAWVSRDGEALLANGRLRPYFAESLRGIDPDLNSEDFTDYSADNFETLAGKLMVDGAFNINSTSLNAWKAILSSGRHLQIPRRSHNSTSALNFELGERVFSRTDNPFDIGFTTSSDSKEIKDAFWDGYRSLTRSELDALASEIVQEVKERGPFLSLADFINRDPSGTPQQQRKGALQAALDRAVNNNIANTVSDSFVETDYPNNNNWAFKPEDGLQGAGFPGYVLQGDVLQRIGPMLAARSDTFTIRVYGNSLDQLTGGVKSEAWCEAVVQRTPEPLLGEGDAMTVRRFVLADRTSREADQALKDSIPLGRKFKIVSFRWLSEDEV